VGSITNTDGARHVERPDELLEGTGGVKDRPAGSRTPDVSGARKPTSVSGVSTKSTGVGAAHRDWPGKDAARTPQFPRRVPAAVIIVLSV
jgi:hypothetical protein